MDDEELAQIEADIIEAFEWTPPTESWIERAIREIQEAEDLEILRILNSLV